MSSLKCALACSVAGNQERRGLSAYTQLARTLKSPMDTCGGATRVQLRAVANGAVKVLIPRKMEAPRLAMRIGRSARGRGRSQGYAHVLIGRRYLFRVTANHYSIPRNGCTRIKSSLDPVYGVSRGSTSFLRIPPFVAEPRYMTKWGVRDEWGRFSSVVVIYLSCR